MLEDGTVLTVPSRRHTDAVGYDRDFTAFEPWLARRGLIRYTQIGEAVVRRIEVAGAWEGLAPLFQQYKDLVLASRSEEAKAALQK